MLEVMMQQSALIHQLRLNELVLIRMGHGDEALCYQTSLEERLSPHDFVVSFHDNSLMLERVRLVGKSSVEMALADGQTYAGYLRAHDTAGPTLLLHIAQELPNPDSLDHYILPLT